MVAVPSSSRAPSCGGRPTQRAPSTRSTWPCAKAIDPAAAEGSNPLDDPIGAVPDLGRDLAARAAVVEHGPAGPGLADLLGRHAFVLAVVPLVQVGDDGGRVTETGESAGLAGSRQRAGQHQVEVLAGQPRTSARAASRPRSVSGRSVVPVCRPERLHSVSPCRASQSSTSVTAPGCPTRLTRGDASWQSWSAPVTEMRAARGRRRPGSALRPAVGGGMGLGRPGVRRP